VLAHAVNDPLTLAGTDVKPLVFCTLRKLAPHPLAACTPVVYNDPLGLPYVTVTLGVLVVNGDVFVTTPLKYAPAGASHMYIVALGTAGILSVAVVPLHTLVGMPVNGTVTATVVGVLLMAVNAGEVIVATQPLSSCTVILCVPTGKLLNTPELFCDANPSLE